MRARSVSFAVQAYCLIWLDSNSGCPEFSEFCSTKVLDVANAEHIPYDAFLGKPYMGAFPEQNISAASNILAPIRADAQGLTNDQRALYMDYLNKTYVNARLIEQGLPPFEVSLPSQIPASLDIDNLIQANRQLQQLR
ncbi:hypothetical protein [Dyella acidisoli]|uniref:Uncharacterized protein n=1 Tax=Dyella acidisoli TaxID=1867834 RepID=A0ABQ5XNG9_9GAMM|nr:hypothetical protein [Dyella acidisoli]GLQ92776.1 hypothetical protein GCM10007901_17270 [Dyella acidisoli]